MIETPKIDPKVIEHNQQMEDERRRRERMEYIVSNIFNILSVTMAFVAVVIAALTLILELRQQSSNVHSCVECAHSDLCYEQSND